MKEWPKKFKWLAILFLIFLFVWVIKQTGYFEVEQDNGYEKKDMIYLGIDHLQGVLDEVKTLSSYFADKDQLLRENEELRTENAKLERDFLRLKAIYQENKDLKELLAMKSNLDEKWEMVGAKVVTRNINHWYHTVVINRGISDGIDQDMAVINKNGLVGRVIKVYPNFAEVLLISDPEGNVAVKTEISASNGVIEVYDQNKNLFAMKFYPYDIKAVLAEQIFTSGLGGIYPPDILVGEIKTVETDATDTVKDIFIQGVVDFERLDEVLVIKKNGVYDD